MKILYACHQFFPEYYTGTERYTLDLARQMQKMGHEAVVLTYVHRSADGLRPTPIDSILEKKFSYDSVPVIGWRHRFLPPRAEENLYFRLRDDAIKQAFFHLLDERGFDVVHCTHPMRVAPALEAAKERGLPVVLHLTDYWLVCPRATLLRPGNVLCEGPAKGKNCLKYCYREAWPDQILDRYHHALECLEMADTVISPSLFLIEVFKKAGVNTDNFIHHPHGFDYHRVTRHRKENRTNKVTFGFLGTLLPHKGVDLLLDAFRKVQSNNIELKIFGGYFYESAYYQKLLQLAEGDERIAFCGEYDFEEVGGILRDIDVIVVPSLWYENAPLVISSAHAFGIPVIAANLGGMAEMVRDGAHVATFPAGDVAGLAKKIRSVATNPTVLQTLKKAIAPPPRIEGDALNMESLYAELRDKERTLF